MSPCLGHSLNSGAELSFFKQGGKEITGFCYFFARLTHKESPFHECFKQLVLLFFFFFLLLFLGIQADMQLSAPATAVLIYWPYTDCKVELMHVLTMYYA